MFTLFTGFGSNASAALKAGIAAYKAAVAAKNAPSVAGCAVAGATAVRGWEPALSGRPVLSPALRAKLADALGHLAYNIAAAEAGHSIV